MECNATMQTAPPGKAIGMVVDSLVSVVAPVLA